jgi:hypothetical protein
MRLSLFSPIAALVVVGAAHADLTNTIVQVNATAGELEEAGCTRRRLR